MDLINKIESLRYDIENGVETDVISISVRLIKIRDQALQLRKSKPTLLIKKPKQQKQNQH